MSSEERKTAKEVEINRITEICKEAFKDNEIWEIPRFLKTVSILMQFKWTEILRNFKLRNWSFENKSLFATNIID